MECRTCGSQLQQTGGFVCAGIYQAVLLPCNSRLLCRIRCHTPERVLPVLLTFIPTGQSSEINTAASRERSVRTQLSGAANMYCYNHEHAASASPGLCCGGIAGEQVLHELAAGGAPVA